VNFSVLTQARPGSCRTLIRTAALVAACLLSTAAVRAQAAAAAPAAGGATKIGVINIRQAIAGTAEGKQAGAELQSQFAPRQNELEGMNKQISDVRQRLDAGQGIAGGPHRDLDDVRQHQHAHRDQHQGGQTHEDMQVIRSAGDVVGDHHDKPRHHSMNAEIGEADEAPDQQLIVHGVRRAPGCAPGN